MCVCMCVCVCVPPCTKGSHSIQISFSHGHVTFLTLILSHAMKLWIRVGRNKRGKGNFEVPCIRGLSLGSTLSKCVFILLMRYSFDIPLEFRADEPDPPAASFVPRFFCTLRSPRTAAENRGPPFTSPLAASIARRRQRAKLLKVAWLRCRWRKTEESLKSSPKVASLSLVSTQLGEWLSFHSCFSQRDQPLRSSEGARIAVGVALAGQLDVRFERLSMVKEVQSPHGVKHIVTKSLQHILMERKRRKGNPKGQIHTLPRTWFRKWILPASEWPLYGLGFPLYGRSTVPPTPWTQCLHDVMGIVSTELLHLVHAVRFGASRLRTRLQRSVLPYYLDKSQRTQANQVADNPQKRYKRACVLI